MTSTPQTPWRIGWRAARANLAPGLVLQGFALALGCAYFLWPPFQAALNHVARWQNAGGAPCAMGSRAFFSGVIPYFFALSMPASRPRRWLADFVFGVLLWAFMGFLTYHFYALQNWLYGARHAPLIVTAKMLTDMLFFTPFVAVPITALAHLWKDYDYDWRRLGAELRLPGWHRRLLLPTLIPNWALWAPATLVIYSLPLALQVHITALIGCFWALMCLHIAGQVSRRAPAQ